MSDLTQRVVDADEQASQTPSPSKGATAPAGEVNVRLPHQRGLDGLRGLAVVAVVLYHTAAANGLAGLERFTRGGFLGVSAFFTLSGFLIVSLLIRERRASGTVSLRGFWRRRARRLLPALFLLVGGVLVLTPLVGSQAQLSSLPGDAWSSLLYVANWHFIVGGTDYAAMFNGAPSPLRHVWSLAVEEQWYVLLPLAALVGAAIARRTNRIGRRQLCWILGAVVALGTGWMVFVSGAGWDNRAYMGTDTRLAEMAVGAFLAVALGGSLTVSPRIRRFLSRSAPFLLVALVLSWALTPIRAGWLYSGGLTLHAVVVALLIAAVVQPDGLVRRLLGSRTLVTLGVVSYGIYLFHWPIIWWLTPQRLGTSPALATIAQLALTLAVSAISYKLVEHPIRRGTVLAGFRVAPVALGAAALLVVGILVLPQADHSAVLALGNTVDVAIPTSTSAPSTIAAPTTPPPTDATPGGGTEATTPTTPTTTTTTAAPAPPLRVMVVGDSFAESIVIGLQRWGMTSGKMAVMDRSIPGCPFGRGGRNKGVSVPRDEQPDCTARDGKLLRSIKEFNPEVVLLAGGMWDVTDRRPVGFSRWTRVGRPDYDRFLRGEMNHLLDLVSSGGAKVLWANSPYWSPVPGSVVYMGKPPYPEAQTDRVDLYNQMLGEEVAKHPNASVLDIASWMRARPGGEFDPGFRPDGVHFSEASTDTVATWLGPVLLSSAGR